MWIGSLVGITVYVEVVDREEVDGEVVYGKMVDREVIDMKWQIWKL